VENKADFRASGNESAIAPTVVRSAGEFDLISRRDVLSLPVPTPVQTKQPKQDNGLSRSRISI